MEIKMPNRPVKIDNPSITFFDFTSKIAKHAVIALKKISKILATSQNLQSRYHSINGCVN
jgi:hypothetical protein